MPGPNLHVVERAVRMRTGNRIGVLNCCVEVCRLDMFAECDAAVIMEAVGAHGNGPTFAHES